MVIISLFNLINMKILKIQFCHPVKGTIHLFGKDAKEAKYVLNVDSGGRDELVIPLEGVESGDWKLFLKWEFDGREFVYEKKINIS